MFKGYAVADIFGCASVYIANFAEREIFFVFFRRTNPAFDNVACLQPILLDLLLCDVYVVGRCKIIVIA